MTHFERDRIKTAGGPDIQIVQSPCPALDFIGRCSVYEIRPLICRLWGVVETMKCHYGCEPERYLTDEEGKVFFARLHYLLGENSIR